MSDIFVCIMGIGTVFVGLISIVAICKIMSLVVGGTSKKAAKAVSETVKSTPQAAADLPIQNKQAIIAGTCAVIAQELGTEVSNIKVLSFKRV